jgi:hypothetical protein
VCADGSAAAEHDSKKPSSLTALRGADSVPDTVASWGEIEAEAPELAARARERLDAHVHKTLATLRRAGAPRVSGTEVIFHDGDLWLGSMPGALKARDLRRDTRFALLSGSDDPPDWAGDAKIAGRAEEIADPARRDAVFAARVPGPDEPADPDFGDAHLFRLEIDELSVVRLNDARDGIVIDVWTAAGGLRRIERA